MVLFVFSGSFIEAVTDYELLPSVLEIVQRLCGMDLKVAIFDVR